MKKLLIASAIVAAAGMSASANAALAGDSVLNFNPGTPGGYYGFIQSGSYFAMDNNSDGIFKAGERTGLTESGGVALGTTQAAGEIDAPWTFFSNIGNHLTTVPTTVLSATGSTASVDFSGWTVSWNDIIIPMGAGDDSGVASVTCAVDCSIGDTYSLDYLATVPLGDPSGFGDVSYQLHLEGTINPVPVPAAVWLFGSGLLGLVGIARRRKVA